MSKNYEYDISRKKTLNKNRRTFFLYKDTEKKVSKKFGFVIKVDSKIKINMVYPTIDCWCDMHIEPTVDRQISHNAQRIQNY